VTRICASGAGGPGSLRLVGPGAQVGWAAFPSESLSFRVHACVFALCRTRSRPLSCWSGRIGDWHGLIPFAEGAGERCRPSESALTRARLDCTIIIAAQTRTVQRAGPGRPECAISHWQASLQRQAIVQDSEQGVPAHGAGASDQVKDTGIISLSRPSPFSSQKRAGVGGPNAGGSRRKLPPDWMRFSYITRR
jgi:hypothetical protein